MIKKTAHSDRASFPGGNAAAAWFPAPLAAAALLAVGTPCVWRVMLSTLSKDPLVLGLWFALMRADEPKKDALPGTYYFPTA